VLEGEVETRVRVPGGVVIPGDVEQERLQQRSRAARPVVPVDTVDCVACHILPSQQSTMPVTGIVSHLFAIQTDRQETHQEMR